MLLTSFLIIFCSGLCSFLVSAAMVLGTAAAVAAVERCGRKPLLAASAALMCTSILGLAAFFFVKEHSGSVELCALRNSTDERENQLYFSPALIDKLAWLPLVSLISYVVSFSIGGLGIQIQLFPVQILREIQFICSKTFHDRGLGPLPWTVNAEIFPPEAKAVASATAFAFNWTCAAAVTRQEYF